MRMNEATASEARVLSDAEIAMVAGGTPLDDAMYQGSDFRWLDDSHTFAESNGIIAADYTHDGSFEEGWRPDPSSASGYERTITGITWDDCERTPTQERAEWYSNHQYWWNVDGG